MEFPMAHEISKHVRNKKCKFFSKTSKSAVRTSTITSSEAPARKSLSPENLEPTEMYENLEMLEDSNEAAEPGPSLTDDQFTEILSPPAFKEAADGNQFDIVIEEQVVEVDFDCKICDFR